MLATEFFIRGEHEQLTRSSAMSLKEVKSFSASKIFDSLQQMLPPHKWHVGQDGHRKHTKRLLSELNMLKDQCMISLVPRVHKKLMDTVHLLKCRLTDHPDVQEIQNAVAYKTVHNVMKIKKHVHNEVNKACDILQGRFKEWMREIQGIPEVTYNRRLRVLRNSQVKVCRAILRGMKSVLRWLLFYLFGMQLGVKEDCWRASSLEELNYRLNKLYERGRRLTRTVVQVLQYEVIITNKAIAKYTNI